MFLEHYLAEFALQHEGYDEAKLLDILSETLRKMSLAGRQAAQGLISAPAEVAPLLEKAVNRETQNVKRVSNARDSGGDSRSSLRVSACICVYLRLNSGLRFTDSTFVATQRLRVEDPDAAALDPDQTGLSEVMKNPGKMFGREVQAGSEDALARGE